MIQLATCEDSAGDDTEALVHYARITEPGYDEARARKSRPIVLLDLGRFGEARAQAVQLSAEDKDARISLMMAFALAGASQEAIDLYLEIQARCIADNLAWGSFRASEPDLAPSIDEDERIGTPDHEFGGAIRACTAT